MKMQPKFSIAIVGEGLPEWMYFDHIRVTRRYSFSLKPDLPKHSDYLRVFKKGKDLVKKNLRFGFLCY
ncbi:MAG: hypothetical protein ACPKM0_11915 [Pleomorphochaeta sp.]